MSTKRSRQKKPTADRLKASQKRLAQRPRCGLCGATGNLTQTECCDQWICNDEDKYEMFSYARNSCHRNHRRFTLCAMHFDAGHDGRWQDCEKCRALVNKTEMYVYFGTNEYNFEKLENPPSYEPTTCCACGAVIPLAEGGYSISKGEYKCSKCSDPIPRFF